MPTPSLTTARQEWHQARRDTQQALNRENEALGRYLEARQKEPEEDFSLPPHIAEYGNTPQL